MQDPELIDMLDEHQLRRELKDLVKKYVAQSAENSLKNAVVEAAERLMTSSSIEWDDRIDALNAALERVSTEQETVVVKTPCKKWPDSETEYRVSTQNGNKDTRQATDPGLEHTAECATRWKPWSGRCNCGAEKRV